MRLKQDLMKQLSLVAELRNEKLVSRSARAGQPGALSSCYARVPGKGPTTRIYCTQPCLPFLQEVVSKARTRDLQVTWQQLYQLLQVSSSARDAVKRASKETASIKRAVQSLGFDVYFTADGDCNVGIERNPTEIPQRSVCAVGTEDINGSVSHSEKADFSVPVSLMEDSVTDNPLIRVCESLCPMHTRDGECQWPDAACA